MRRLIIAIFCLLISSTALAQEETLTPYEIAQQRIAEAKQSGATVYFLRTSTPKSEVDIVHP